MPGGITHDGKDILDEFQWNSLVKQVAHRIDENHLRFFPGQRETNHMRMDGQVESISIVRLAHRLQAFRHALGIAVLAPRADFSAARQGIPGGLGPFNRRLRAHLLPVNRNDGNDALIIAHTFDFKH